MLNIFLLLIAASCYHFDNHATVAATRLFATLSTTSISHSTFVNQVAKAATTLSATSLIANDSYVTFNYPMTSMIRQTVKADILVDERHSQHIEDKFQALLDRFLWSSGSVEWQYANVYEALKHCSQLCQLIDSTPGLVDRISREIQPEIVLIETIFMYCAHLFAHRLNTAQIVSIGIGPPVYRAVCQGLPVPRSYVPSQLRAYSDRMTFTERIINTIDLFGALIAEDTMTVLSLLMLHNIQTDYFQFKALVANVSLLIANEDVRFLAPRPLIPSVHFAAGLENCDRDRKENTNFGLGNSVHHSKNTIIICLSTMSKAVQMPHSYKLTFIQLASLMPEYNFLWKLEHPLMIPDRVRNIQFKSWLPMKQLMASGKVASMITSAGINIVMESLMYAIPTVTIPLFGDQPSNARRLEQLGVSVMIPKTQVNAVSLRNALLKLMSSKHSRERLNAYSRMYCDTPKVKSFEIGVAVRQAAYRHGLIHNRVKSAGKCQFWIHSFDVLLTLFTLIALLSCILLL